MTELGPQPIHVGYKEWAAICEALVEGRQLVLLRKGGIAEDGGAFAPEFARFALVPTYWHQSQGSILADAQTCWDRALEAEPPDDAFRIRHAAVLTDQWHLTRPHALAALREEHIWSDDVARERFDRGPSHGLFALLVRVYALPAPVTRVIRGEDRGCKSWVHWDDAIGVDGSQPVLSDTAFTQRRRQIVEQLQAAGV